MAIYEQEKFTTRNKGIITFQNCKPEFANLYPQFASQIADETTFTSQFKERIISIEEIDNKWRIALNSSSQLELGAFNENKLIAQLSLRKPSPNHPWTQHIGEFGLGILKEYWSQGIGSRMIQIMENISKDMDIHRMEGRVRCENERGIALYLRHGFRIEGIRKQAAIIKNESQDEYYIAKLI